MAKGGRRGGQPPQEPPSSPEVPEGEPEVSRGEEEMDPEVMRNLVAAMQAEITVIKANQENVEETIVLQQAEIDRQRSELAAQQEEIRRRQKEAAAVLEAALQLT